MKDDEGVRRETVLYRLEVAGSVPVSWLDWFEADTIAARGENTVMEVRVTDQAELYGRLRRIHDLNLHLISLTSAGPGQPGAGSRADTPEHPEEQSP